MTLKEKLEFCKKCKLRSFSSSTGVVCSITDEKPAFHEECPDYEYDLRIEARRKELENDLQIRTEINNRSSLDQFGIKNKVVFGVLMMAGAILWFIVGASKNVIFFYPPIMFFLGLTSLVRGIKKRKSRTRNLDKDLLDNEL